MKSLLIFIFFLSSTGAFAQLELNDCPETTDSRFAYNSISRFLLSDRYEGHREEYGILGTSMSDLEIVRNFDTCQKLLNIVNSNSKFKSINDTLDEGKVLCFYKTGDHYYIFWAYTYELSDIRAYKNMQKQLFIVVSKDLKNIWELYK